MGFDPVSYLMGKAAGGGGGGTSKLLEEWDFTSATPTIGNIRYTPAVPTSSLTFDNTGAVFDGTNDGIALPCWPNAVKVEIDLVSMSLGSQTNRRFIIGDNAGSRGLVYRSTGRWGFYANDWEMTDEADDAYFAGSTVSVVVDNELKWHIYKDDVLWFEPSAPLGLYALQIGSTTTSIINTVVSGVRIYSL